MTGTELIAAERQRQIEEEGWTAEHDGGHAGGELAWAACYYAVPCPDRKHPPTIHNRPGEVVALEPDALFPRFWSNQGAKRWDKPRVRQLVVAGALIAAEIDRFQRAEKEAD